MAQLEQGMECRFRSFGAMSKWNHRVLRFEERKYGMEDNYYALHEVYYNEDGKPNGYAQGAETLVSETVEGIKWYLDQFNKALEKPILWGGDKFPQEYKEEKE
jgi:hypothetical protein